MKKNTLVMIGGFAIAGAILLLLLAATPASSGVELKLKELVENGEKYKENYITVEGLLIEESIKWNADEILLEFDVQDEEGNRLRVAHKGVKPDNFSEGVIAILQGFIKEDGTFEAETVKTRCPSKYEGEDMENYDPEFHKDKLDKSPEEGTDRD
ncbi:cytochrome c maturation protein CcmE [Bacillus sp. FJAT-27251]|uniref:cytochrome c maturation protein CcmE n=1 Tax=Bacillus sp. FJAT-27251 TaxID=1684142 RepID=UPI0006A796C5|nr:cytochrome c maturation protein CcmE [Bacillus sp. FJAT-27251]